MELRGLDACLLASDSCVAYFHNFLGTLNVWFGFFFWSGLNVAMPYPM